MGESTRGKVSSGTIVVLLSEAEVLSDVRAAGTTSSCGGGLSQTANKTLVAVHAELLIR
jgi:hypothetical protein